MVVGFRQIDEVIPSTEAVQEEIEQSDLQLSPPEEAAFLASFVRARQLLEEQENASSPGVLSTATDGFASLLQSHLAELAESTGKTRPLAAGGVEAKFDKTDVLGWARVVWVKLRSQKQALPRPAASVTEISDQTRIGIVGDWGTGLYGAPRIARAISTDGQGFDLLLHLGDVYYSGTRSEIRQRFLRDWPLAAAPLNRALNSNHEMYSGGEGYLRDTLSAFGQTASYFALRNSHWLFIGLDTGYVDHDIDDEQREWLTAVLGHAGSRQVILFSHHQLFSHFGSQGSKLSKCLGDLLSSQRIDRWYWGHEHLGLVYDRDPKTGLVARCVGHGGMPEGRGSIRHLEIDHRLSDDAIWRRIKGSSKAPGALVLDGVNRYIKGEEDSFGPHGYMTLEFDGPHLIERMHDPEGTEILRLPGD